MFICSMKNAACESISTNNDSGDGDDNDIFGALAMSQPLFQGFHLDELIRSSKQPQEESTNIIPFYSLGEFNILLKVRKG